jgi:hypothetical protein
MVHATVEVSFNVRDVSALYGVMPPSFRIAYSESSRWARLAMDDS